MQTRKYPRTLNEAFGPYAHLGGIQEPVQPYDVEDKIVLACCAVGTLAVIAFFFLGWI
jgi:hypothetical protein